jgi:hypothetical protein
MPRLHPGLLRQSQLSKLQFSLSEGENCPQRNRFPDAEDVKRNVTAERNIVPLEVFADCFQKRLEWFNKCIQVGRDYFE